MRKRQQYSKPKSKTHVPMIIIMSVMLFLILYFGKDFSNIIAGVFAPNVPVTDAPVAVQDTPQNNQITPVPNGPSKSGTVVSQAYKTAAQNTLKMLANPQ
jgi:hypothetical protein